MNNKIKKNTASPQSSKLTIKKRHWCLGTAIVVLGSWITHTTTAEISDNYSQRQALAFAKAIPNSGTSLRNRLPNNAFVDSFKISHGPISDSFTTNLSPADYIFEESTPTPSIEEISYKIKRGDTLGRVLSEQGIDLSLPHAISQHETAKELVSLSVGSELVFGMNDDGELKSIRYPLSALQNLVVGIDGNDVSDAEIIDVPFQTVEKTVSGEITSSLYEAAIDAGMSINHVMEMVRIFGWDIDFVLDIRGGDSFHVIFEENQLNGEKLSDGNIIAAEFTTQNKTYRAIRFTESDGTASYYTPEGESMLGTFLRSPVEFSRISSRFGQRKHPILKTWRAHKGVDYAANRGTPIRATADGKIIHAGNKGGYGRTVILRHAGRFSTLYAHMNGFAKGIRSGGRVKQGDVIGYIGSSGLATGPHLHYEFRLDGVHRNPLTFKTPKASSISPELLAEFKRYSGTQLAKLDQLSQQYLLAKQNIRINGQLN